MGRKNRGESASYLYIELTVLFILYIKFKKIKEKVLYRGEPSLNSYMIFKI